MRFCATLVAGIILTAAEPAHHPGSWSEHARMGEQRTEAAVVLLMGFEPILDGPSDRCLCHVGLGERALGGVRVHDIGDR